jgi:UPF0042 nucleotide-binding protein
MDHSSPGSKPRVLITTYGSLHGAPPRSAPFAVLALDLRHSLRNPFDDPAMRELTGLDPVVRDHVLNTDGADAILADTTGRLMALLDWSDRKNAQTDRDDQVTLHVFCKGGRHRSVAVAEEIAATLRSAEISVGVEHRDVTKPVIQPTSATQEA